MRWSFNPDILIAFKWPTECGMTSDTGNSQNQGACFFNIPNLGATCILGDLTGGQKLGNSAFAVTESQLL